MDKVRLSAKFWTFLEVIPNFALVVVLLLGALGVGAGELTLGTLVAFITLMLSLVWPIASLGYILAMAQEAMTAADRVNEIFDTEPAIVVRRRDVHRAAARAPAVRGRRLRASPTSPTSRCCTTSTSRCAPGETVAIVGATGSGKTTLTALVPRLYDVTAGRVTIDGVDVRDLALSNLRADRRDRLRGADAVLDERAGEPHARPARRHRGGRRRGRRGRPGQFVHDLPWGLDTRIGEQGMSLSGGQRQRLALARAVLAQPRILVLDDTLSALDVHTEALVEEALRRVLADATGIVVAHRASTVLLADKVALLQDGTITHVGDAPRAARHRPGLPRAARGRRRPRGGGGMSAPRRPRRARTAGVRHRCRPEEPQWRGVAAEDRDDDLDRRTRRPARRTGPAGCSATCCARTSGSSGPARSSWSSRTPPGSSIPYLVKEGIDRGIPPIQAARRHAALLVIVGARAARDGRSRRSPGSTFLVMSGKIGQDMLLELRRRVFGHFQKLSPAFHDEYTSGRVISRQTSDIDAIYEMLETGFDGLVTARAHAGRHRGPAARPRRQARRWSRCSASRSCSVLTSWFRKESAKAYRVTRETVALVIVHFVESMQRHPRGAGVPPRAAQPGDLRRRQRPVPRRQPAGVPAGRAGSCPASS